MGDSSGTISDNGARLDEFGLPPSLLCSFPDLDESSKLNIWSSRASSASADPASDHSSISGGRGGGDIASEDSVTAASSCGLSCLTEVSTAALMSGTDGTDDWFDDSEKDSLASVCTKCLRNDFFFFGLGDERETAPSVEIPALCSSN